MNKLSLLLLLLFLVPAAFAQSNGNGGCVAVATGLLQGDAADFRDTFSATKVVDVDFAILFTPGSVNRFADTHTVEFRIFTPRGHLYQSITIPFTSDPAAKGKRVKIEGYPDPQPVSLLTDVTYLKNKHLLVKVALPVAGTPIISNSLYGQWRAEAYVDDEPVGCAKPALFTITQ